MKRKFLQYIGILFIIVSVIIAIVLINIQTGFLNSGKSNTIEVERAGASITVSYPKSQTIFPPEIASPTFKWVSNKSSRNWFISFSSAEKEIYSAYVFVSAWKPDSALWEIIKIESENNEQTAAT